jgi:hypothetical protein
MKKQSIKAGSSAKLALPRSPTVWVQSVRGTKATIWYIDGNGVLQTVSVPMTLLKVANVRRTKK